MIKHRLWKSIWKSSFFCGFFVCLLLLTQRFWRWGEKKCRKAYLVWAPAVCPKTGICVWQLHRCSWQGPGTRTTAPWLSGCPATSASGWWDSRTAKTHRHKNEEAATHSQTWAKHTCHLPWRPQHQKPSPFL